MGPGQRTSRPQRAFQKLIEWKQLHEFSDTFGHVPNPFMKNLGKSAFRRCWGVGPSVSKIAGSKLSMPRMPDLSSWGPHFGSSGNDPDQVSKKRTLHPLTPNDLPVSHLCTLENHAGLQAVGWGHSLRTCSLVLLLHPTPAPLKMGRPHKSLAIEEEYEYTIWMRICINKYIYTCMCVCIYIYIILILLYIYIYTLNPWGQVPPPLTECKKNSLPDWPRPAPGAHHTHGQRRARSPGPRGREPPESSPSSFYERNVRASLRT